ATMGGCWSPCQLSAASDHDSGCVTPQARAYSASAKASHPPAFGVTAEASAAAPRATAMSFCARVSQLRTAPASRRARASAASSACARSPRGAHLDADRRRFGLARLRQTVLDSSVRVGPAALPEGESCEIVLVEAERVVLAPGGPRGLEVRAAWSWRRPISTAARMVSSQCGKLEVMLRSAAALSLSASSQLPIASSASIWFAASKAL